MSDVGDRFGIAVIAVTRGGARLGGEIAASLGGEATTPRHGPMAG